MAVLHCPLVSYNLFRDTKLARFTVPGMTTTLLLSGPQVQLDSSWLSPRCKCQYCTLGNILLSWSLLVFVEQGDYCYFSLQSACISHSDTMRASTQRRGFQDITSSNPSRNVSKVCVVFKNIVLPSGSDRYWPKFPLL